MIAGDDIREIRKRRGLTQKKLGQLCGINEVQIRQYELGKANPKPITLDKIAEAIDALVYYDHETHQTRLIAFEDGQVFRTYKPGGESENTSSKIDNAYDNPLSYENSYSYASSEEEYEKMQREKAAIKAPRFITYDENGNKIKDGKPPKFTDRSMSKEEAIAEAEATNIQRLHTAYRKLNLNGKLKAIERVEELTEISRYTKPDNLPEE